MLRIDVVTTFPELFGTTPPAVLGVSIPARAIRAGAMEVHATDIREYAANKHAKTDDRPFGGGPGMVMSCQPLWDCVMAVEGQVAMPAKRVLMTPQGEPLTQGLVEALSRESRLLLIAGHYEGIDERVIEALEPLEVSLGDYVLSGGELGALVLIDAMARLLPGVLGDEQSNQQDSFSPVTWKVGKKETATERLLDCPHYTKPRDWMGRVVPEILLSGDHGKIEAWRLEQRLARTKARRPDLLEEK
ncbi:MAG: tRNA (guanosine(37)-N1)-methyltransferase TrmD [Phycisphaerales bacterium]|jgi:tRNA (guanine37-N1)-methyltransferase